MYMYIVILYFCIEREKESIMYNIVVVSLHLVQAQLLPTAGFELKKTKSPASPGIKLETKSRRKSGCFGRSHGSFKKNKRMVKKIPCGV